MEQENRLEQNRYSIAFVGLSTAQEADSFTANTCVAARKADNLMETLMRKKENALLSKSKRQGSE